MENARLAQTPTKEPAPQPQASQQEAEAEETSSMPPVDAKEHLAAIGDGAEPPRKGDGDANGAEEDEEVVVTLADVLHEDAMLTEAADAVLGNSSTTDCSYAMGYMRQALYACLTCTPESEDESKRAGVCLACTYNCHEGHILIELYTKRNFRCDCGNDKFPKEHPCKLLSGKAPQNERNVYSQNFTGKYCSCHRPYPDPEATAPEVMVQCVVCEDWLHDVHIFSDGDVSQIPDDFDDFICVACMAKHPFLLAYDMDDEEEDKVTEQAQEDSTSADQQTEGSDAVATADQQVENGDAATATTGQQKEETQKLLSVPDCILEKKLQALENREDAAELKKVRPTFWAREWREALCKCSKCVAQFEKEHIAFLLDPEDSLQAYEESARARQQTEGSAEDMAQKAFSSKLSHQQQVEMAIGYNHMKNSLQEYLATFAAGGKTVRAEDIQSFFEDLRQKKRQKTEP
uniref:UBR-type domain-containing protein n=1 Tax=Globisporangium ultimum (strain ATCC 200006 / CBS 805.95 / DAOM BR144) TaxID=431595 RepID=K3XB02_GLOUD